MFNRIVLKLSVILLLAFSISKSIHAADKVKVLKPILDFDKRVMHKDEVILRALQVTESEYGPFTLEEVNVDMTTSRAFSSMKSGDLINIFIAPSSELWEKNTIAIKVPIRQGLLSYRLLLVNKADLPKFKRR